MKCFADETGLDGQNACVALGMFDGVHLGHVALLKTCVDRALTDGVPPFVYTYSNSPHPQKQREVQGLLTTTEEKLSICESIGIQGAVVRTFSSSYSAMSPEDFTAILFENDRVSTLICGQNYRFGINGKGDAKLLSYLGKIAGKRVICVDDLMFCGQPISSTRVRKALLRGECGLAAKMTGRPYTIDICINGQETVWPPNKARIGAGGYVCEFCGQTITTTVQNDGIIVVHEHLSANNQCGTLAFVARA